MPINIPCTDSRSMYLKKKKKKAGTVLSNSQKRASSSSSGQSRVAHPWPFISLHYLPVMDGVGKLPYSVYCNHKFRSSGSGSVVLFVRDLRYSIPSAFVPSRCLCLTYSRQRSGRKISPLMILSPHWGLRPALDAWPSGRHPTIGRHSFVYSAHSAYFQKPLTR